MNTNTCNANHCATSAVYGLGLVGAAVYYIQQAVGFGAGIVGLLKALVWPAFVVHKFLSL